MSLLVILLALWVRHARLLDEPAAMLSGLMRSWRDSWLQRGSREGWGSAVVLAFIVLPPVLLTLAAVSPLKGLWHALLVAAVSLLVMLPVLLDRRQPDAAARAATAWSAHRWQPELVAGQPDLAAILGERGIDRTHRGRVCGDMILREGEVQRGDIEIMGEQEIADLRIKRAMPIDRAARRGADFLARLRLRDIRRSKSLRPPREAITPSHTQPTPQPVLRLL